MDCVQGNVASNQSLTHQLLLILVLATFCRHSKLDYHLRHDFDSLTNDSIFPDQQASHLALFVVKIYYNCNYISYRPSKQQRF